MHTLHQVYKIAICRIHLSYISKLLNFNQIGQANHFPLSTNHFFFKRLFLNVRTCYFDDLMCVHIAIHQWISVLGAAQNSWDSTFSSLYSIMTELYTPSFSNIHGKKLWKQILELWIPCSKWTQCKCGDVIRSWRWFCLFRCRDETSSRYSILRCPVYWS